jgi:hypothetical protein
LRTDRVHRFPASRFVTIGRNVPRAEAGWGQHGIDLDISAIPKYATKWHDGQFAHGGYVRDADAASNAKKMH